MLKIIEGLQEKLQNKEGLWKPEFENGFYVYINKDSKIDFCSEQETDNLESKGYKVLYIDVDNMGETIDDIITYVDDNVSTLNLEQTIKNLIGLKINDDNYIEFFNDIICAFDTTEKQIVVSSPDEMNSFNAKDGVHSAYENLADAPIIEFRIKNGKIVDAWEV